MLCPCGTSALSSLSIAKGSPPRKAAHPFPHLAKLQRTDRSISAGYVLVTQRHRVLYRLQQILTLFSKPLPEGSYIPKNKYSFQSTVKKSTETQN